MKDDETLYYTIKPKQAESPQQYQPSQTPQPTKEAEGLEKTIEKEEKNKGLTLTSKIFLGLGTAGIAAGAGKIITGGSAICCTLLLTGGAAYIALALYYSRKKKR